MYAPQYTSSFEVDPTDRTLSVFWLPAGACLLYATWTQKEDRRVITVYYMAMRPQYPVADTTRYKYLFHVTPLGWGDLPFNLSWCIPMRIEGSDSQCPHFLFYAIQP